MRDIQLARVVRLMPRDPVGEVQLPCGRRQLGRVQQGLGRGCTARQSNTPSMWILGIRTRGVNGRRVAKDVSKSVNVS